LDRPTPTPLATTLSFGSFHVMKTVFHTTAEELDESCIASVKAASKRRPIEITVTAYLLRHPANRERPLRAVAEMDAGENIVTPDQAAFR
jgi:hypothetical protein